MKARGEYVVLVRVEDRSEEPDLARVAWPCSDAEASVMWTDLRLADVSAVNEFVLALPDLMFISGSSSNKMKAMLTGN